MLHRSMATTPEQKRVGRAMRSSINWALLGLVIERPSYGLELYNRFHRVYADVLPVSGESHVYAALNGLEKRELIETVPNIGVGRQPKPHYQATPLGVRSYEDWLVDEIDAQRRHQELWVRQLAVLARDPEAALHVLDRYERRYLKGAGQTGYTPESSVVNSLDNLINGLVNEQRRIAVGGMLSWLRYAHARFEALTGSVARDEPPRA
jgi:DNA-binding PadR family transcriptional regulator